MTQSKDSLVTLINNQNYTKEINQAGKPVLLLCMPKSPDFSDQAIILHQIAKMHKDALKVCLLEEERISGFRRMQSIKGTPVFLLFYRGEEKGRMLGMAGMEELSTFLSQYLKTPAWASGEETSWEGWS
jgi:hypothetical protein